MREISTTESSSNYNNLEEMSVYDILSSMNNEDLGVAKCVQENLHSIEKLVNLTFVNLNRGDLLKLFSPGIFTLDQKKQQFIKWCKTYPTFTKFMKCDSVFKLF